jgi:hypothetical protein
MRAPMTAAVTHSPARKTSDPGAIFVSTISRGVSRPISTKHKPLTTNTIMLHAAYISTRATAGTVWMRHDTMNPEITTASTPDEPSMCAPRNAA